MNRGSGRGRGRGGQKLWRPVNSNSSSPSPNHHTHSNTPIGADVSSNGRMPGSSRGNSNNQWQERGRGSGGQSQGHLSKLNGESCSRGERSKQRGSTNKDSSSEFSPVQINSLSLSEGVDVSSLNDQTVMEHVDNVTDTSRMSEKTAVNDSLYEQKAPEEARNVQHHKFSERPKSSLPFTPFDICPPKSNSVVILKTSLLDKNREKRKEKNRSAGVPSGTVLRSGMVLLKNYLSSPEQVRIIRTCRTHGRGSAGFYQPCFSNGGKMHLQLMCFGEFWDPETSRYGKFRPIDGAKPLPVPEDFLMLVDRAVTDSHPLLKKEFRVKNAEEILPSVKPDICIVNYYSNTGRLGLHQDKDEGRESLRKGIPIVSFSIGDSAEFLYSDQGDPEKADKVTLESGDVLIFGGKSRHIFHGVSKILPETAPKSLLEDTDFLPGRLNLTFRQSF